MTGKWAATDTLAKLQDTHDAYGIGLSVGEADYQQMMALFDSRDRALAQWADKARFLAPSSTGTAFRRQTRHGERSPPRPDHGTTTGACCSRGLTGGMPAIDGDINFGGVLTTKGGITLPPARPTGCRGFRYGDRRGCLRDELLPLLGAAHGLSLPRMRRCLVKATGGRFFGYDGTAIQHRLQVRILPVQSGPPRHAFEWHLRNISAKSRVRPAGVHAGMP